MNVDHLMAACGAYRETLTLVLSHLHDPGRAFPFAIAHTVTPGSDADQDREFLVKVVQQALSDPTGLAAHTMLTKLRQQVETYEMTLEAINDY